ncbi:hypothetical protein F5146DRAFT_1101393 [Armillaria mellea]|nr:hypothetical protein F5146DRAFT_1101393 [Armillaria mellea]
MSTPMSTSNENHSHLTVTHTICDENVVGIDSEISEVKDAALFIKALHSATLEESGMDLEHIVQLCDAPSEFPFNVYYPHFLFLLRAFFAVMNSSQDTYHKIHAAALDCYPDDPFPSFNIMNVNLITHDMCINSCIVYTGPYIDCDSCFECGQSHYDDHGSKPHHQFDTIPIGPVLQALYLERTASILEFMKMHEGKVEVYDDILFWNGKINDSHILIGMSLDDYRYKKIYVIPGGTIGGPNKLKHITSFLFPSLYHVSALQKEGLWVWDGILLKHVEPKHPYFILCMADGPAMAELSGMVDRDNYYNLVMLKPVGDYNVPGCSHNDVTFKDLLLLSDGSVTAEHYQETGLTQPTIFNGLDSQHTLGIPNIFGLDIMHLNLLNDTDLFLNSKENWDLAVFHNTAFWEAHRKTIAMSTEYFPFFFDCPPRNPAEKLNSEYKAQEFLLYLFDILPSKYWVNYCKGSHGIQIFQQHCISPEHLYKDAKLLAGFIRDNLGREICQFLDPYANVSQHAVLRAQINSIQFMILNLEPLSKENNVLPSGALDLGESYAMLCPVNMEEVQAIRTYWQSQGWPGANQWYSAVIRSGCVCLPNGKTACSCWSKNHSRRATHKTSDVKVMLPGKTFSDFTEVQYYFCLRFSATEVYYLAMVSIYSPPNLALLEKSFCTVYVCQYEAETALQVLGVKDIQSVVAMVPNFKIISNNTINILEKGQFLVEKPGLELVVVLGIVDEDEEEEEEDNNDHSSGIF